MAVKPKTNPIPLTMKSVSLLAEDRDRLSQSQSQSSSFAWEEVSTTPSRRAVSLLTYGDTDSGRSTFALTAPGPIAYIHAYEKVEGIIQARRKDILIRQIKFGGVLRGSAEEVQKRAEIEFSKVEQAVSDAYRWARSIILDTETRLWEVCQLARLGSLSHAQRNEKDQRRGQLVYQEINNRWSSLLAEFRVRLDNPLQDKETNLILICKTKDEYRKNKESGKSQATGRTIRASQKDTGFFADVIVRTYQSKGVFRAVVEKPWWNRDMRGFEMTDDMISFPLMMGLLTNTDTEEWEK